MLDEKDLQAIGQLIDQKLTRQKDEILDEATHRMRVLLDAEVKPQFNLLAEGQQEIGGKLVPRSRVDDLEDEVKFLKTVVRQISEEVQKLKKAQ